MQPSSASLRAAETFAVFALTFATVALLGGVLAYWTWTWIAPRPASGAPAAAQAHSLESAYRLFGGGRTASAPARASFALIGVASRAAGSGYAIVHNGTRTVVVREGEE